MRLLDDAAGAGRREKMLVDLRAVVATLRLGEGKLAADLVAGEVAKLVPVA